MSNSYRPGQAVHWHWRDGTARGRIAQRFERRVQRTIKDATVVRNGSPRDPAYLIEQDGDDLVLKLGSELSAA